MCEANAYVIEKDGTKLVMEAVDTIEPDADGINLISIFGDRKFLKAGIHSLSLVDHKVYLKMNTCPPAKHENFHRQDGGLLHGSKKSR